MGRGQGRSSDCDPIDSLRRDDGYQGQESIRQARAEKGLLLLVGPQGETLAQEITSAEAATEIALAFARKHSLVVVPLRAVREDGLWLVEVDVGLLRVLKATFKIDAQTGTILEYSFPEGVYPPLPPAASEPP